MSRKVWIAILSVGLLLFVLLDVVVLIDALNSNEKFRMFGFLSGLLAASLLVYRALRRRIDQKPGKPAADKV